MSELRSQVVNFIMHAAIDYHHPSNVDMQIISPKLEDYDRLNINISQNLVPNEDLISLITNFKEGVNGWLDIDRNLEQNRYKYVGLVNTQDTSSVTSLGVYSGKIAFRKELIDNAIEGGYIKNIKQENLFKDLAVLPGVVKSVLENAPMDIVSLGRNNLINKIDELKRNNFLTQEEHNQWIYELKSSLKDYPEYKEKPEGAFNVLKDKISIFRENLFSKTNNNKLER